MARPPINLNKKIKEILDHTEPPADEFGEPLSHYRRSTTDMWNLLGYFEKLAERLKEHEELYEAVRLGHMGRMHSMVLVSLIESFERFLKESAVVCVNELAQFTIDDRFDTFQCKGSSLAANFGGGTLGHTLCESAIWLDCKTINSRFRDLLADPFEPGNFQLLPKQSAAERVRHDTLSIIWQLRHSVVHNVGMITLSDATKLRILAKGPVQSPRVLNPSRTDLRYLKRFLDEMAEVCNMRIGQRLAELLSAIHVEDPSVFDAQQTANQIAKKFLIPLNVHGIAGVP